MKKSRMPIEWFVGLLLFVVGIIMSNAGRYFYAEEPTWFHVTQISILIIAAALLIVSALRIRKTRKENLTKNSS